MIDGRRVPLLLLAALPIFGIFLYARRAADSPVNPKLSSRTFEFTYQVHLPPASLEDGAVRLWIPEPTREDPHQTLASELMIVSNVEHMNGRDPEYNNNFIVFRPSRQQAKSGFDVLLRFEVTRREYVVLSGGGTQARSAAAHLPAAELQRYLRPDRLVPLDGAIAKLARQQTVGATTPIEKARKIYDYVVSTMRYDKSGQGWGRGDAVWACDSKRGNCTDFHSVFIGMMRASGIPARFEIGFPLPETQGKGAIAGYHCWSEFYIDGVGWIPVDASEASQNPAKRNYFFGAVDANRVLFTYGRDIRLSPEQKGPPLNYFIYPYAEMAGRPVTNIQAHFAFRDISSTRQSGS